MTRYSRLNLHILCQISTLSVTARSVADETRNARRNAQRNPEW